MAEKHYEYVPSPSAILRSRGTIVENSYQFVREGELTLKNEKKVACDFEVGYMQDASAWAVVYITLPENMSYDERRRFDRHIRTAEQLTGIEGIWNRNVTVTQLFWTGQKGSAAWGEGDPGIRVVFAVGRFEIGFEEQLESTYRFFDLVNLPVYFSYSPKSSREIDRADAAEQAFAAGVDAAIRTALEAIQKQSPDEARDLALAAAEAAKTDSMGGFLKRWFIPIKSGEDILAQLYWRRDPKEIAYPLEPMSQLSLDTDKIPSGWELETVTDWLCALFSMALGRDIQWIHWAKPTTERDLPLPFEVWQARNIQHRRFNAFVEEPYDAGIALDTGLHERNEWTLKFVGSVLEILFHRDMQIVDVYLDALGSYVQYASTPAPSYEFECTLLSVLGEYLYKTWRDTEKKDFATEEAPEEKKKRQATRKAAREGMRSRICSILPPNPGEDPDSYKQRLTEFNHRYIRNAIQLAISASLADKIKWFFQHHDYNLVVGELNARIEDFVNSRNSLAHNHCFHNDKMGEPEKIGKEIANIRMMIPLMLAVILGYQGRYWDSYRGKWGWSPKRP